jgi:uncharacterized protein YjbJ (UPF0337 family)
MWSLHSANHGTAIAKTTQRRRPIAVACLTLDRKHELLLMKMNPKYEENAMNWDTIQGKWKEVKGQVKEQWGKFSDDDLDRIEGKRDQLVGKVQQKYGVAKDEAERQVKDFESHCNC